jgi:hypothetical protein
VPLLADGDSELVGDLGQGQRTGDIGAAAAAAGSRTTAATTATPMNTVVASHGSAWTRRSRNASCATT